MYKYTRGKYKANKTIKITLFQNAMWGGTTANDTDLVVNHNGSDTIIQSDIDTSDDW